MTDHPAYRAEATDHGEGREQSPDDVAYHTHPNHSGVRIGTVLAATAEKAIKVAMRDYGITDPERQRRLIAQRVGRAEHM